MFRSETDLRTQKIPTSQVIQFIRKIRGLDKKDGGRRALIMLGHFSARVEIRLERLRGEIKVCMV